MTEHTQKSFEIRPGGHTSNEGGRGEDEEEGRKEEGRRCWNERQGLPSVVKEFLSAAQNMCVPRGRKARCWLGFCPLRDTSEPYPTASITHHTALSFDGDWYAFATEIRMMESSDIHVFLHRIVDFGGNSLSTVTRGKVDSAPKAGYGKDRPRRQNFFPFRP